ncbi:MAG: hypothetical protein U5K54_19710 [Cytophagales bacterium]|nr:hypothetical protein [Cytophagales bacterium]
MLYLKSTTTSETTKFAIAFGGKSLHPRTGSACVLLTITFGIAGWWDWIFAVKNPIPFRPRWQVVVRVTVYPWQPEPDTVFCATGRF